MGIRPLCLGNMRETGRVRRRERADELRPHRRRVRARRRARRDGGHRRNGLQQHAPLPGDAAPDVHLRVRVLRASRFEPRRHQRLRGAEEPGTGARQGAPHRRRRRDPGARLGRARDDRVRRGVGNPVRARPRPQPLRRPHLHRAAAEHPPLRRAPEAEPGELRAEGQARRRRRRQHRPRHHQPQDRQDAARRRRERGAHAHLEPAHAVALLLRHRHADARRAHRLEPHRRGDQPVHHERHARLPLARRHEGSRRGRAHGRRGTEHRPLAARRRPSRSASARSATPAGAASTRSRSFRTRASAKCASSTATRRIARDFRRSGRKLADEQCSSACPTEVSVYEVSPRDGLQNEAAPIPLDGKQRARRRTAPLRAQAHRAHELRLAALGAAARRRRSVHRGRIAPHPRASP